MRERLIAEDRRSEEIIKPILRGRDIARYRANWANLWLLSTFPSLGLDIDQYPAVKRHLLTFGKQRLAQSGQQLPGGGRARKKTAHEWFELQDTCAYHEEFSKNKLFWMHMSPYGRFALGEEDMLCNQKVFMVTGRNLEYLCAVLNSALVTWLVKHTSVTTGMGLCQWDKFTVERIPVVHPDDSTLTRISEIVGDLVASIAAGETANAAGIQRAIDDAVFDLYGITTNERASLIRRHVA